MVVAGFLPVSQNKVLIGNSMARTFSQNYCRLIQKNYRFSFSIISVYFVCGCYFETQNQIIIYNPILIIHINLACCFSIWPPPILVLLPLLLPLLQDVFGLLILIPLTNVCGLLLPLFLPHVSRLLPLLQIALLQDVC